MTLISELIDVPDQVRDGDFVLKLTEGVSDDKAAGTVADYVVTDDLRNAFDRALGLIASAVKGGDSQATYLHGSFGSGKSHFMAVLHLLLTHHPAARNVADLHPVIAKHDPALSGKNILLVPLHFLDAKSMDAQILGGYVEHIGRLHPDAAPPRVFVADQILESELPGIRSGMGDETFAQKLNDAGGADEWGEFANKWTTETIDAALAAPATDEQRRDLGRDYISAFRSGTAAEARSTGEGYVNLDDGLAEISRHAKELGYDAIVLFLDELILWLASRIADLEFVTEQSGKLTKLVEGNNLNRPAPIVSFVARQRDLTELVGDHVLGAELRVFADTLELQTGRFEKITLEDRNLPVIAQKRILAPTTPAGGDQPRGAVDDALGGHTDVTAKLLGSDADMELFRQVYPFSPTLVNALIAVSEALQRERTALKVMQQLLVDGRHTLRVGDIIPVGDLWDVVAARDEPFSAEMKRQFDVAKKLYAERLRPMLLGSHQLPADDPAAAAAHAGFRGDDRIIKTILLAGLVNQVDAFRDLDASRLVALNWGSVTSRIKGRETQTLVNKLRQWAAAVGELKVGDDPVNPRVSITLVDVDTQTLIDDAVQRFDNAGARRQAIRRIIDRALDGIIGDETTATVTHLWRGTDRTIDVVFGNVRNRTEIPDPTLTAHPGRPKVLIDFPFDQTGQGPQHDLDRLDAFTSEHGPTTTVCWLPSFLSQQGQAALRDFVALDHLLAGNRYEEHTRHLSAEQRRDAKPILTERRAALDSQLSAAILTAYGVTSDAHAFVDPDRSLTDHYRTLDPSVPIRPTVTPTLLGAFNQLCDQLLEAEHPAHPEFAQKVTGAQRKHVWSVLERALGNPDGQARNLDPKTRPAIANVGAALELGTVGESHFVLANTWRTRLDRHLAAARDAGTVLTVGEMRSRIDDAGNGASRGLPDEISDLVIYTVAAQTDHAIHHAGHSLGVDPARALPTDARLVPEQLPTPDDWAIARNRGALVFGVPGSELASAAGIATFADAVRAKVADWRPGASRLTGALADTARHVDGISDGDRTRTAAAGRALLDAIASTPDAAGLVATLVAADIPTTPEALATSLVSGADVAGVLDANTTTWSLIDTAGLGAEARTLLRTDELPAGNFADQLGNLRDRATNIVVSRDTSTTPTAPGQAADATPTAPGQAADATPPGGPAAAGLAGSPATSATSPPDGSALVTNPDEIAALAAQLAAALDDGPITVTWRRGGTA